MQCISNRGVHDTDEPSHSTEGNMAKKAKKAKKAAKKAKKSKGKKKK